ncbi:MAG: hypothetical protein WA864_17585 [Acetobacteraceae bacterium]
MAWWQSRNTPPPLWLAALCTGVFTVIAAADWINPLRPGWVAMTGRGLMVVALVGLWGLLIYAIVKRRRG